MIQHPAILLPRTRCWTILHTPGAWEGIMVADAPQTESMRPELSHLTRGDLAARPLHNLLRPSRQERERPVQGRKHGALRVATRSRAAFFGRGGFHFVILRQADEFLDAPSELRNTLGIDIE